MEQKTRKDSLELPGSVRVLVDPSAVSTKSSFVEHDAIKVVEKTTVAAHAFDESSGHIFALSHSFRALPLSSERRLQIDLLFALSQLRTQQSSAWPSTEISQIVKNATWLGCFLSFCGADATAAARLIFTYATWRAQNHEVVPAAIARCDPPLLEFTEVCGGSLQRQQQYRSARTVAVLRDVRVLSRLVSEHNLSTIVLAQVESLERLLLSSANVREGGVHIVQDLSQMSTRLAFQMAEPSRMLVQATAARFVITSFPIKLRKILIVDAPYAFSALFAAAKQALPFAKADSIVFLNRPQAVHELREMFGETILT